MSEAEPVRELPLDDLPPSAELVKFLRERCASLEAEAQRWEDYLSKTARSLHDETQAYFDTLELERTNARLREQLAHHERDGLLHEHEWHETQARLREKEIEVEQLKQQVLSLLEIRSPLADRVSFTSLHRRQQPDSVHVTDVVAAFREAWREAATRALTPDTGRALPARERRLAELGQHPDQLAVAEAARAVLRAPVPAADAAAAALLLQTAEQRAEDLARDYEQLRESQARSEAAEREAWAENALQQQRVVNGQAQLVQDAKLTEAELRREVLAERLQAQRLLRLLGEERCAHARTLTDGGAALRRLETQNAAAVRALETTIAEEQRRSETVREEREARERRARRAADSTRTETAELRERLARTQEESAAARERLERELRSQRLQLEAAQAARADIEAQLRAARAEADELRSRLAALEDAAERKRLRQQATPRITPLDGFRPRL